MLYHLSFWLKKYYSFFNVIHYVTFRTIAALLTSLFLSLIFGNWFIKKSQKFFKSQAREYTPNSHQKKSNTPIMGGIFILVNIITTIFLWANLSNPNVWIIIFSSLIFGAIGFIDDISKIKKKKGISAFGKFILQTSSAASLTILWIIFSQPSTEIYFPFFKNLHPDPGLFLFIIWSVIVIVGCSNAVNLTDGLDGLAISSLICNFVTFSIISYIAGHSIIASYLNIPFASSAELTVIGGALIGASLGFLWYNTYPAQIFMGDVGSLFLGATLGLIALMTKQEFLLVISGGLFVIETLSVIAQVISFKFFKKRIFKMAPLHHHFEIMGWPESKITARFAIISVILSLLALITIKIR